MSHIYPFFSFFIVVHHHKRPEGREYYKGNPGKEGSQLVALGSG